MFGMCKQNKNISKKPLVMLNLSKCFVRTERDLRVYVTSSIFGTLNGITVSDLSIDLLKVFSFVFFFFISFFSLCHNSETCSVERCARVHRRAKQNIYDMKSN